MAERIQMNLRLDGRRDLLEAIKSAAGADKISVNAWAIRAFEAALGLETNALPSVAASDLELLLDKMLAEKLADIKMSTELSTPTNNSVASTVSLESVDKMVSDRVDPVLEQMATIEERLGKLSAPATAMMNRERQELNAANQQLAEWDVELNQLHERNRDLGLKVQTLEQKLETVKRSRDELIKERSAATVAEFPEAADLLNR